MEINGDQGRSMEINGDQGSNPVIIRESQNVNSFILPDFVYISLIYYCREFTVSGCSSLRSRNLRLDLRPSGTACHSFLSESLVSAVCWSSPWCRCCEKMAAMVWIDNGQLSRNCHSVCGGLVNLMHGRRKRPAQKGLSPLETNVKACNTRHAGPTTKLRTRKGYEQSMKRVWTETEWHSLTVCNTMWLTPCDNWKGWEFVVWKNWRWSNSHVVHDADASWQWHWFFLWIPHPNFITVDIHSDCTWLHLWARAEFQSLLGRPVIHG